MAYTHRTIPERTVAEVTACSVGRLSIIVPVLNEAAGIGALLADLQPLRHRGHEIIVVDGGSDDDTLAQIAGLADVVVEGPRGRARQMNAGAARARGTVLWFVHADTRVPPRADTLIHTALGAPRHCWGRFDVRLSGRHGLLRVVERLMNLRSRLTGIATGDQAIFVERTVFMTLGAYADIPLMEDIELSRRLRSRGRPACLHVPVVTSSRRWEERGVVRTILLMWRLRLAYALGVDPARLAGMYR